MIEITDETRWEDLTDEEKDQLSEEQAQLLLERSLLDPATGNIVLDDSMTQAAGGAGKRARCGMHAEGSSAAAGRA